MSMIFKTGFREVMRLDSSGNLGIGTGVDPYIAVYEALKKWPPGHPRRHEAKQQLFLLDRNTASVSSMWMVDMTGIPNDDNTYRIGIFPDGIDVICFGLESVDSQLEGHYDRIDDLPNWVKERIAVLNMIPATPPTSTVEGVGRRISAHVYWVFAPTTSAEASTSA